MRRKIDAQVTKSYHEHLVLYTDAGQTEHVWQWVKREAGKPAASRENTFRAAGGGDVLIQKAHDTARELFASRQAVISGFQSPAEREMLTVLLRGQSPIVIYPARGLEGMRIPAGWKPGLEAARLLLLSPFPANLRRATAEQAERRNRLVFSLAERALIVHATPGGKLESLCREMSGGKVDLFTFDSVHNQNILSLGAQIWAI